MKLNKTKDQIFQKSFSTPHSKIGSQLPHAAVRAAVFFGGNSPFTSINFLPN